MREYVVEHVATMDSSCLLYIMEFLDNLKDWYEMRTRRCGKGLHEVTFVTKGRNSKAFDNIEFLSGLHSDVEWEYRVVYEGLPKM